MIPSRPTIADVARMADVSIATVSRVLNGSAAVEGATAERVRSIIAELHYIPHPAARTLASHKTNTIGLLLPEINSAFFQPLLRGIEASAREAGYDLLIHTTQMPRPTQAPSRPLTENNTDGLLVYTDSLDERELTRLSDKNFPAVLLYQTAPKGVRMPSVTIENQCGARQIVEHLIEVHNRRRIVYLKGPEGNEDSEWREKGYREALQAHDMLFDRRLLASGGFNRDIARQAVEKILLDGLAFDAIFAADDNSAVGVYQALHQAGRKIPEEIAVAGFDDQVFASSLAPALTSVRAPIEQVGREAVHQLRRIMRGESVEAQIVLPTELVIRQSCGCHI